jgi:hypothetical protein
MAINGQDLNLVKKRMVQVRGSGHAVSARYDRRRSRIVVALNTGVKLAFPTRLAEIIISPAGLGLHWPNQDADLYVPALLQGVFGSKMARQHGAQGGRARTVAKRHRVRMAKKGDGRRQRHQRTVAGHDRR